MCFQLQFNKSFRIWFRNIDAHVYMTIFNIWCGHENLFSAHKCDLLWISYRFSDDILLLPFMLTFPLCRVFFGASGLRANEHNQVIAMSMSAHLADRGLRRHR